MKICLCYIDAWSNEIGKHASMHLTESYDYGSQGRSLVVSQSKDSYCITGICEKAVFGLSSSLPPLVGGGGGLVCKSVDKADLLSDHFNGKQYRENVDLLLTCHPSPSLTSFAFRSSEVRLLLLDLDPYGGSDPLGMFPLFLKRTADVRAPRLSVVFRRLVRLGSFPACWRQANVTPNPNGPTDFQTPVLYKVFERLVSVRLG